MTREAWLFQRALLISLVLHALLLILFFTLPGGGPAEPVQIYTVRIAEAPARPEARELTLSTDAISALKLEGPSLRPDQPPLATPEQAEVPEIERLPAPAPPTSPAARAPSAAPTPPGSEPATPGVQPPSAPASRAPPALPGLPAQPPTRAPRAPAPPAVRSPGAQVLAPPAAVDEEPQRPSAMEQLRSKVQSLNLQVETAPPQAGTTAPVPSRERNVLSLRMYSNRVREAVKEQYTFPGSFDASLRARVRVVLNRDGSVRGTELLESSGNERFDRLVCMSAFNNARIPPVPQNIEGEGDTLTLYFTCSP
ncbi:MAG TPA: TonB C-terminal domain-containing protein [bacterium]